MAALVWVMVGLAIWHFTVFLPDHFWAGIVGAFLGAVIGSILFGLALHGFDMPSRDDTDILTAFEGIPGAIIGMAVVYWYGYRQERAPVH
jgi:hypothetical protein